VQQQVTDRSEQFERRPAQNSDEHGEDSPHADDDQRPYEDESLAEHQEESPAEDSNDDDSSRLFGNVRVLNKRGQEDEEEDGSELEEGPHQVSSNIKKMIDAQDQSDEESDNMEN